MIQNALKTKTVTQVRNKVCGMIKQIASNPKNKHAKHAKVLNNISLTVAHKWNNKEEATFVKMLQKYGKNYKLISAKIPTKTHYQVSGYGRELYKRIQNNPKHRHSALKKKLEPNSKPVPWTTIDPKLLLRGLKKHVNSWDWVKRTQIFLKNKTRTLIDHKIHTLCKNKSKYVLTPVDKEIIALTEKHSAMRKRKH